MSDTFSEPLDQNKLLAEIAVQTLERAGHLFISGLADARRTFSATLRSGHREFRHAAVENYGKIRTFLHRDRPISLEYLYVPIEFEYAADTIIDADLIKGAAKPCRILIQGTAGSGKSVFLKYLNLAICKSRSDIIPAFFELKSLNTGHQTIVDAISSYLGTYIDSIDADRFVKMLGHFEIVLILDGFDELNYDLRERYSLEIKTLCERCPNASVIVSSRPEDSMASVNIFSIYHVKPFSKPQAISLLERLPYDGVAKRKFISAVNEDLYSRHESFLSNPLLITMMLITYHQFAEIPSKIHIFYQQAFEALFSWHDAQKDVFKRKSYSNLALDEFQRAFSSFCVRTYSREQFSFTQASINESLRAALQDEGLAVTPELFLKDLVESTCLIGLDGLNYVFAHRSFQEYFSAYYVSRLDESGAKAAIDAFARRAWEDLVVTMSFEMNVALLEKAWSLPVIKALIKKINSIKISEKWGSFESRVGYVA